MARKSNTNANEATPKTVPTKTENTRKRGRPSAQTTETTRPEVSSYQQAAEQYKILSQMLASRLPDEVLRDLKKNIATINIADETKAQDSAELERMKSQNNEAAFAGMSNTIFLSMAALTLVLERTAELKEIADSVYEMSDNYEDLQKACGAAANNEIVNGRLLAQLTSLSHDMSDDIEAISENLGIAPKVEEVTTLKSITAPPPTINFTGCQIGSVYTGNLEQVYGGNIYEYGEGIEVDDDLDEAEEDDEGDGYNGFEDDEDDEEIPCACGCCGTTPAPDPNPEPNAGEFDLSIYGRIPDGEDGFWHGNEEGAPNDGATDTTVAEEDEDE